MIDITVDPHPALQHRGSGNAGFVHDLSGFYVIMEVFFYAGFVMMLFLRQNKMVGVGERFQFILRDESGTCLRLRPHQQHRDREPRDLD